MAKRRWSVDMRPWAADLSTREACAAAIAARPRVSSHAASFRKKREGWCTRGRRRRATGCFTARFEANSSAATALAGITGMVRTLPDGRPDWSRHLTGHPTVKPIALLRHLVRLICPPGGLVLDPFAGSGTTLEAAHREGRDSIGVELDASHAASITGRMSGLFG